MSIRIFSNYFNKCGINPRVNHQKLPNIARSSNVQPSRACTNSVTVSAVPMLKKEKTSRAMRAYLQRAREHDEFMKNEKLVFQIGKRHLANMMGEEAESFTQGDIHRAIQYLFPSGLFSKKARPLMKPPEAVFPKRKAAEFDESGRPHHPFFYTGKPNFYKLMYDIVDSFNELYAFEDKMLRKGLQPDPTQKVDLSGFTWVPKDRLEKMLVETIMDREYEQFVAAFDRLVALPYSYKVKDLIDKYRKPLLEQNKTAEIPEVQYDEKGRAFITTYECLRKRARGDVTVISPGTGDIKINGREIDYFEDKQCREQS
ncbi:small ribosomal subunit protein uS9m [Culicoides brevitarsis]|uniref:small ribosomal subunit protein uS9m n=1 Tax=Culicoides brevitarsis TaxID=469753 RepID=UPI00307B7885